MIVPGVRALPRAPRLRLSLPLNVIAVIATVVAWAALVHSPVATDVTPVHVQASPSEFHSVVYSAPSANTDSVYVRSMAPGATAQLLTTFPVFDGLHAHGATSPAGTTVAVLAATAGAATSSAATAQLSIVSVPSGVRSEMGGSFAYLSRLVWSPDGRYVFATTPQTGTDAHIDIVRTDIDSEVTSRMARFPGVFEAAPIGFSADGQRLYIVTVDKSGSTLWQEHDGQVDKVAALSAGRTRDWSLSPDGAWLAFVDVLSTGSTGLVGRTLTIATGTVTTTPAEGNQVSPAWAPGSDVPVFGGPGGQLRLTSPTAASAYPAPLEYSPDGTGLVATVYPASSDGHTQTNGADTRSGSLELVSPTHRTLLTDAEGASFFGWVRTTNQGPRS